MLTYTTFSILFEGALSVYFSSIAIEFNVPRDEISSIAIELHFVTVRRDFKKASSVFLDIGDSWDKGVFFFFFFFVVVF